MSRRSVLTARLFALFSRKRLERELEDEIRFHLDMQAEDNRRTGMNQADAGRAAARSFGGVETMKEQVPVNGGACIRSRARFRTFAMPCA